MINELIIVFYHDLILAFFVALAKIAKFKRCKKLSP